MLRSAVLVALVALLVASPLVAGTVNPNPRTSPAQGLSGPVTALAVAANTGHVAAGMADPSRSFPAQSDLHVWRAWDAAGNQVRDETADKANCTGSPLDDCTSDVVDIAVSADGTRIVVAAKDGSGTTGRLVFATMNGGIASRQEYATDEAPTSVALSPDGTKVAVGLMRPAAMPDVGRVRQYTWSGTGGGTVTQAWSTDTTLAVTAVAISSDGRVSAAAGDRHYRFSSTGAAFVHDTDATLNAVAFANAGPSHYSVAGAADGGVLLYSDGNDAASASAEFDLQPGTSAQNAVAIVSNATLFVAGDAAGIVRLFRNAAIMSGGSPIASSPALDGAVADLQMSADGRFLAVAAGRGTYLFRIADSGLTELWRSVGSAAVTHVGISGDGEYVSSSTGSTVTVFTSIHSVTASIPSSIVAQPGKFLVVPITYTNSGNRPETVTVERSLPVDWTGTLSTESFTLQPEGTVRVDLNVTPPTGASPGTSNVLVTHRVRGIPFTTTVPVQVASVRQWSIQPEGALNRDIEAGATARFPIRLTNLGNGDDTTAVTATIDLEGWSASVSPSSVTAARGKVAFANVTVTAPATATDLQSAKITLAAAADATAGLQLTATVGAHFSVSAAAVPESSDGTRGQATTFKVRVTNSGNSPDSFTLTAGAVPTGWSLTVDSLPSSNVAAGASLEVSVHVTPAANAAGGNYELSFTAKSKGDTSVTSTARHTLVLGAESDSSSSSSHKSKGSPAPTLPSTLAVMAIVALALRRRGRTD